MVRNAALLSPPAGPGDASAGPPAPQPEGVCTIVNRLLPALAVGTLIALAPACGGSGGPAASPAAPAGAPADQGAELPKDTKIVDVPVTRPETPQPVDPQDLPAKARAVSQMPGLSADEKVCADYAIKSTLDKDPSIARTNGKVASVLGNSVVACTAPAKLATLVSSGVTSEGQPLTDEQRSCMEKAVADDQQGTARFLSALLTLDVSTVMEASKKYDETCGIQLTKTG
jgi:hypothetical protein